MRWSPLDVSTGDRRGRIVAAVVYDDDLTPPWAIIEKGGDRVEGFGDFSGFVVRGNDDGKIHEIRAM